jgi:hypothetical protein
MLALADDHGCELIGGDTTKGPLTLSITVFGDVPRVRRCGATRRPGDDIWISGTLGDARLALGDCRGEWLLPEPDFTLIRPRMEMPTPRVALGLALRGVAHAALDISDGLIGDLGHILERSSVGAIVDVDALPRSEILGAQPEECQRVRAGRWRRLRTLFHGAGGRPRNHRRYRAPASPAAHACRIHHTGGGPAPGGSRRQSLRVQGRLVRSFRRALTRGTQPMS